MDKVVKTTRKIYFIGVEKIMDCLFQQEKKIGTERIIYANNKILSKTRIGIY